MMDEFTFIQIIYNLVHHILLHWARKPSYLPQSEISQVISSIKTKSFIFQTESLLYRRLIFELFPNNLQSIRIGSLKI